MTTSIESPFAAAARYRLGAAPLSPSVSPAAAPAVPRRTPAPRPPSLKVGQRVGEWTLLSYTPGTKPRDSGIPRTSAYWMCRCSCGVVRRVQAGNLTGHSSKSCGHTISYGRRLSYVESLAQ